MSETMMRIGAYRFAIATAAYQSLERTSGYTWARQTRVGTNDALQFTGPGPETLNLSGVIYPYFRGGLGQLDGMRRSASIGIPLPLIDGRGRVLGLWAIESVTERQAIFDRRGIPKRQDFEMRLTRYDGGLRGLLPF